MCCVSLSGFVANPKGRYHNGNPTNGNEEIMKRKNIMKKKNKFQSIRIFQTIDNIIF